MTDLVKTDFKDWRWVIRALSKRQRETLDQIAVDEDGGHHPATLKALERRGLIEGYPARFHGVHVTRWRVPLHVHIAWASLCAEEA